MGTAFDFNENEVEMGTTLENRLTKKRVLGAMPLGEGVAEKTVLLV